ncbi:MAG: pyridoxamine 5'-phosphate oxidase family protein [Candidatus Saccharimonadales bacterium]
MSLEIQSTTSPESPELVRNFLREHYSGVLATADSASNPHAATVYFSLQDDFSLLFGTKTETQKYKNIEENKQVAFVVYDEKEQTTIQITGHVEVIEDEDLRQKVINSMFMSSAESSARELPPVEKLLAGDYVALRLVPMVIKMAVFARPDSEGDDLYETLLFSGQDSQ